MTKLPEHERRTQYVLAYFEEPWDEPSYAAKRRETTRSGRKGTWTGSSVIENAERFPTRASAIIAGRRFLASEHAVDYRIRCVHLVEVKTIERYKVLTKPVLPSKSSVVDQVAALAEMQYFGDGDEGSIEDRD